jgi:ABC-type antimicrobial peptide transport system permease subunit
MRLSDYIKIALHNIWRSRLRSALTIFAVVIGATSVTIMLSLVFSVKGFMTSQFEANGTLQQVQVSPQSGVTDYKNISDQGGRGNCTANTCTILSDALVAKIKNLNHVVGIARSTQSMPFAAIVYKGKAYTMNQAVAYDANGIITNTILAGRDIDSTDQTGVVVLPSQYADKWGFKGNYRALVGQQVKLQTQGYYTGVGATIQNPATQQNQGPSSTATQGPQQPPTPTPTLLTATVVGVSSDANGNGSGQVRLPLPWAGQIEENQQYEQTPTSLATQKQQQECASSQISGQFGHGCPSTQQQFQLVVNNQLAANGYDSLTVKVDKAQNAASVAAAIRHYGVGAADAQSFIKSQLAIFNIVGAVVGGIGGIALIVAAVGVVNTMVMAILERTREIGVMRAVGAKRSTISTLFTIEASILGFFGGLIGLGIGYVLVLIANPIINKQLSINSIKSNNIISLPPWLILSVLAVTTVIGMLSGLYPARRAARLDPVEALRYE